ncbi:MAG: hypothetical protein FVQ85_09730 [Planctomycetes bacterium]|nr:hypothetical protein [Planctomycetota bacterium]
MNVTKVLTRDYKNKCDWTLGENEPKTNPIYRGVASGEDGSKPMLARHQCGGSDGPFTLWIGQIPNY